MPDWSKLLDEIKGIKSVGVPESNPNTIEEEQQVTVPESKWWQFGDWFSNQDELLRAILQQLQEMSALQIAPIIPSPPPDYEGPVIPPGLEAATVVIAQEQTRTKELLEGFSFITGQATVQTAGTPVELVSTIKTYYVIVRASINNTGTIYISGTGVSAATGYAVDAGEAVGLSIDNLKKRMWIDGSVANDSVSWIALVD